MRTLDNIKHPRICISCNYNSGRSATVRVNLDEPWKIHISIESDEGRPYQNTLDGYLHINTDLIEKAGTFNSKEDTKKAIDLINKHFFAGNLMVFSDDKAIVDKWLDYDRSLSQWLMDIYDAITDRKHKWFRKMLGCDSLTIKERLANALENAKKQKKRIEVIEPLSEAHLGGTWQNYSDEGWLKEAQEMSASKIYLA